MDKLFTEEELGKQKDLCRALYRNEDGSPFCLTDGQAEIFTAIATKRYDRLHVMTYTQYGKQISHDTPVLTNVGWKAHGELAVGDMVFNDKGEQVEVQGLSEESESTLEFEFASGEKIKCHENHEWVVKRIEKEDFEIAEAKEIVKWQIRGGGKNKSFKISVPNIKPLGYVEKVLSIDPYMLGVWLGDGYSSKPSICQHPKDEIIIEQFPYKPSKVHTHKGTGVKSFDFYRCNFLPDLVSLNLRNNKHIPDAYKRSSVGQRLKLLAGLIDTDGYVGTEFRKCGNRDGRVYITNCNKVLVDDIVEVIRSLGMRPSVVQVAPCVSSSGIQGRQITYIIGFDPFMEIPTVLPRKKIIPKLKQRHVTIRSINKIAPVKGRCIQVDGGIYLVGKTLIPTHNSLVVALAVLTRVSTFPEKWVIVAGREKQAGIIMGYIIQHAFDNSYTKAKLQLNPEESIEKIQRERSKNRLTFRLAGGGIGEVSVVSADSRNKQTSGDSVMGLGGDAIVEDESSLLPDEIEAKIYRMITGRGGKGFYCKIGNPFTNGHFRKSYEDPNYKKIDIGWEQGVREGRLSQRDLDEARGKPLFEVLYENKFPPKDAMDDDGYVNLYLPIADRLVDQGEYLGRIRMGIDPSGEGMDESKWVIRDGFKAEVVATEKHSSTKSIAERTLTLMFRYKISERDIWVDNFGVGANVAQELARNGVYVNAVNVGEKCEDEEFSQRFINQRAYAYWSSMEWLNKGGKLVKGGSGWKEMNRIMYKADGSRRIKIMSKQEMRRRGWLSPNEADAFALTFLAPEEEYRVKTVEERKEDKMYDEVFDKYAAI